MTDHPRTPVIVVSGICPAACRDVALRLQDQDPATAVVNHDLRQVSSGIVRRTVRLGTRETATTVELAHGCVTCTVREDLLPLLRRLSADTAVERIVLQLDEAMDPEQVCLTIEHVVVGDRPVSEDVELAAVIAAIDAESFVHDVTGDTTMAERGLQGSADDERTIAHVALAQAEFADVVVSTGRPEDAWSAARTNAILERTAPAAPVLDLTVTDRDTLLAAMPSDARRGTGDDPHGALLRGQPPLHSDCGVAVTVFSERRPFHPERLHDAIDVLLDGVLRARGRVWIASQPDVALWLESAGGGLGVGHLGPWLDSPEAPEWTDVSAERRTLASLRWDPLFGDRDQEIVVISHEADPQLVEETLRGALLTDEELATGRDAWARYPDPFGAWHEEPCDDTEDADSNSESVHNGRYES
ncbi:MULTISPECIES: ribosome hibernation factor-recruiting GTPase MRF [Prauserella salsuginis group]|uniref:Ribosome hibernation factor-recruiting GTPase MRF n=1 Tax=Prauserella salsuginis TaxID=387889 RepID=A0ABW6G8M1_9PSEU|nr:MULTISPECIES: GTP-binding protein [Prauserella salsuginis group]